MELTEYAEFLVKSLVKILLTKEIASLPLNLIIAIAPSPKGVDIAQIVSVIVTLLSAVL